jgi:hypothetical protein
MTSENEAEQALLWNLADIPHPKKKLTQNLNFNWNYHHISQISQLVAFKVELGKITESQYLKRKRHKVNQNSTPKKQQKEEKGKKI